ncbi:hypothetical protein J2Y86_000900 [Pseudomonas migulae]|uniref:hypothetical protein n=1 Tax=Pseudomonas migulae TaxID=78543 RepID=UPI00209E456C|nr:hypothetical protein [Pseudomonas migulae]MCP1496193.1 hypothetical protein [Pseudomonas migulae]
MRKKYIEPIEHTSLTMFDRDGITTEFEGNEMNVLCLSACSDIYADSVKIRHRKTETSDMQYLNDVIKCSSLLVHVDDEINHIESDIYLYLNSDGLLIGYKVDEDVLHQSSMDSFYYRNHKYVCCIVLGYLIYICQHNLPLASIGAAFSSLKTYALAAHQEIANEFRFGGTGGAEPKGIIGGR